MEVIKKKKKKKKVGVISRCESNNSQFSVGSPSEHALVHEHTSVKAKRLLKNLLLSPAADLVSLYV